MTTKTSKQRNRLSTEQLIALRDLVAQKTASVEPGQRPDLEWVLLEAQHAMPFPVTMANVRTAWMMRRSAVVQDGTEAVGSSDLKVVAANLLRLCRVIEVEPLEASELERIAQSG